MSMKDNDNIIIYIYYIFRSELASKIQKITERERLNPVNPKLYVQ